ncbi:MAG: AmmeMemoRadiSam system radical SAM enzyme [Elusimicrobiota bacterium]
MVNPTARKFPTPPISSSEARPGIAGEREPYRADRQFPNGEVHRLPKKLEAVTHPARHWGTDPRRPGGVICRLSPRHCRIAEGRLGFCGVRKNLGGKLVSLNYGKMVHPTEEVIETEAVNHFSPGERILSLGNIGCMMVCDFCHNWKTSQARLAEDKDIEARTPEEIVALAVRLGIRILSWTYNDPVVWHEFVVDTARLARKSGILNLYKSAFYISPDAVEELIEVMDIFSLSLKSMDPRFYLKFTGGRLEPILDGIKQVHVSGRHLEVSNLMVTGRNDSLSEAAKVARWMLDNLDCKVPLHYVRFHPDFKYANAARTPIAALEAARHQAKEMGLENVYLGNVLEHEGCNTVCACGNLLVRRIGALSEHALDPSGSCPACGRRSAIKLLPPRAGEADDGAPPAPDSLSLDHIWEPDKISVHIQAADGSGIVFQSLDEEGRPIGGFRKSMSRRFLVARGGIREERLRIYYKDAAPKVMPLLDRANFPVD